MKSINDAYASRFNKESTQTNILQGIKKNKQKRGLVKTLVGLSAGLAIAISAYMVVTPVSYVSLDINPSIMISTNVFNYVVAITPLNEDAAVMTADVDLKFKTLPAVLDNLMDEAIKTGYITQVDTDNAVLLTVYGEDGIQRTEKQEELKTTVEEHLKAAEIVGEVISNGITEQDKTDAVTYGVSNGKVMFVRNIVTVYPTLVFENLIHESVKNIMRQVNDIRSATRAENTELRTVYQEAKKTLIAATKVKMDAFKSDIQTEVDSRVTVGMTKEQIAEVRKQVIEEKKTEIKAVIQDRNESLKDNKATYFEKLKENRINNRK